MDKFTMNLTWHNCKTNPPKEFSNNNLIVTDGNIVEDMSWHRDEGYFIVENECCLKRLDNLGNLWWADIEQTVQGESKFRNIKRCKNCEHCRVGWFRSKPDAYVCIGVKEPFLIANIDSECTEYTDW